MTFYDLERIFNDKVEIHLVAKNGYEVNTNTSYSTSVFNDLTVLSAEIKDNVLVVYVDW